MNIGNNLPIYINYNAAKIISYVPTGNVIINGKSYVTGGNISSTEDVNGILSCNTNPFTINWEATKELSSYVNQTINYVILSNQTYTNYKLISNEIDPWRNYYAKQYNNIAVNILTGGLFEYGNYKHAKKDSTYPLYQYFSTVLSSNINNILITSSIASYNLNSNFLNGLYTMVNETSKEKFIDNGNYNNTLLYLYKLPMRNTSLPEEASKADHNTLVNNASSDSINNYYAIISSDTNITPKETKNNYVANSSLLGSRYIYVGTSTR